MTTANVAHLKENGLNAIFSKLEAELGLQDAFKILWATEKQCIRTDTDISAVTRTDTKHYTINGEVQGATELKVSIVSCARYVIRGMDGSQDFIDDDIVAQVRVFKLNEDPKPAAISDTDPYGIVARCMDLHLFDRSAGAAQFLCEYVRNLYHAGFRITFHGYETTRLDVFMVKEDIHVKITFFIEDFKHTRLLLAHKNDAYK